MSQLADGTRVYVHNLPWQITNAELAALMEQAGTVESAEVLRFSNGRSKGCAIVKYASVTEAMQAIAMLNNVEVQGRELLVREDREGPQGPAPGSRPRAAGPTVVKAAARVGGGAGGNGNTAGAPRHTAPGVPAARNLPAEVAVCVYNLAWSVTWQVLKDTFEPWGSVYAHIRLNEEGKSRGWGIVKFANLEAAQAAIAGMNGMNINGRNIDVRLDRGPPVRRHAVAGAAGGEEAAEGAAVDTL